MCLHMGVHVYNCGTMRMGVFVCVHVGAETFTWDQ